MFWSKKEEWMEIFGIQYKYGEQEIYSASNI